MKKILVLLVCAAFLACSGGLDTPEERAAALAESSLRMIRAEHLVMAGELEMDAATIEADSAFHRVVRLDPECVERWINTGQSLCGTQLANFVSSALALDDFARPDDPAAVIRKVLSGAPESAERVGPLFEGYAAAFQLCLEMVRDGTLMQDFLPFLVTAGCPLTLRDLGLEDVKAGRLKEISSQASALTGQMPYPTEQEHYFFTFIKINNWASKFSCQVTADTLAADLLEVEGSERVIGHLRAKGPMTVGFFGDSHMDGIHWSTQAPFPDIIEAVFRRINPKVKVINAGVGGDDSGEGLERIEEDLLSGQPDITFVMFGGNDAQHYGDPEPAVTPEQFRINMEEIVTRLRAAGSRVVLMSYPLGPAREGKDLEVFQAIREQTKAVADSMNTVWLDLAGMLDQEPPEIVFAVDMIHFNPTTHLKISGMVLAKLAAMESPDQLQ